MKNWGSTRTRFEHRVVGVSPAHLGDEELERELRTLHETRAEVFFNGTDRALLTHTDRMLSLEYEYARRFPNAVEAEPMRTREGSRAYAGQPSRPRRP